MKVGTACLTLIATAFVVSLAHFMPAAYHGDSSQSNDGNQSNQTHEEEFNWEESLEYYIKKLNDPDPFIRVKAIQALGEIRDPLSLEALLQQRQENNLYVRAYTIEALAKIGTINIARTIPKLFSALKDSEPYVRAMSAKALGGLRVSEATDALTPLLEDDNEMVRRLAKWALTQCN